MRATEPLRHRLPRQRIGHSGISLRRLPRRERGEIPRRLATTARVWHHSRCGPVRQRGGARRGYSLPRRSRGSSTSCHLRSDESRVRRAPSFRTGGDLGWWHSVAEQSAPLVDQRHVLSRRPPEESPPLPMQASFGGGSGLGFFARCPAFTSGPRPAGSGQSSTIGPPLRRAGTALLDGPLGPGLSGPYSTWLSGRQQGEVAESSSPRCVVRGATSGAAVRGLTRSGAATGSRAVRRCRRPGHRARRR